MPDLVGRRVMVRELVARPALNGCQGVAISFDSVRERYQVRVETPSDGSTLLAIKPSNLLLCDGADQPEVVVGVPTVVGNVPTVAGASIVGNANGWAVDRARQVIGPRQRLRGVWQISSQQRVHLQRQACAPLALPPCWPLAVCCAPCVCMVWDTLGAIHGSTIYALTDHQLWRWVEADPVEGTCMGLPLLDQRAYASGPIELAHISSITTELDGTGEGAMPCEARCCPTQQLVLAVPPGHLLASRRSADAHRYPDQLVMYVDTPEEVASLLRDACAAAPAPRAEDLASLLEEALLGSQLVGGGAAFAVAPERMERSAAEAHGARDALETLSELLSLGLITQAEYDAKRAEVIRGIGRA